MSRVAKLFKRLRSERRCGVIAYITCGDPDVGTTLYDLATDPRQSKPFRDVALERRFHAGIARELRAHDAPPEIYGRYGILTQTARAATTEEEAL